MSPESSCGPVHLSELYEGSNPLTTRTNLPSVVAVRFVSAVECPRVPTVASGKRVSPTSTSSGVIPAPLMCSWCGHRVLIFGTTPRNDGRTQSAACCSHEVKRTHATHWITCCYSRHLLHLPTPSRLQVRCLNHSQRRAQPRDQVPIVLALGARIQSKPNGTRTPKQLSRLYPIYVVRRVILPYTICCV